MPLFRVRGIQVYLHWTWLVVAYFEIVTRVNKYQSMTWNVIEYLALFGIVLLHEFGHAFACRQVGGQANRIMLWPLGGVAFVQPPPRPGALLWSIAAGPLVNVILVPITVLAFVIASGAGLGTSTGTSCTFSFPSRPSILCCSSSINGHEAVERATWACNATAWCNPSCLGTLAAACAEVGDFDQAVRWHSRALADPAYRRMYGEATCPSDCGSMSRACRAVCRRTAADVPTITGEKHTPNFRGIPGERQTTLFRV